MWPAIFSISTTRNIGRPGLFATAELLVKLTIISLRLSVL